MSNLTNLSTSTIKKSTGHITDLHNYLLKIAEDDAPYANPIGAAEPLISFNGYYALNATGAFLTIDTNLIVKNGDVTPDVSLIYSPDGTTSFVYHLTGPHKAFKSITWKGTTLKATADKNSDAPSFELTFKREDNNEEITSSVQGLLISEGDNPLIVNINGKTYNNPIPMAMYAGTYYEDKGQGDEILKIGTNNTLQYNYNNIGGNGGQLQDVGTFIFNLNMYVFSFNNPVDAKMNYSIIMGTSAKGGMVCNDLFSMQNPKISVPRSLQTVKTTSVQKPVIGTNPASEALAKFAGFYRLSSGDNAFISIEGEYKTKADGSQDYTVTLGVSMDGISSTIYSFDSTMTFVPNGDIWVLTIPGPDSKEDILNVNFTRQYEKVYPNAGSYYGSVVSISGIYKGTSFTGETLLNVVPLMGFAGATLKIAGLPQETIVIKSSSEIVYNSVSYKKLTIVPLMYIVGFIDTSGNEVILSLGTDGGKGNTCLTTVSTIKNGVASTIPTSVKLYTAIPDGDSGMPSH
jgi:hypothetical protein